MYLTEWCLNTCPLFEQRPKRLNVCPFFRYRLFSELTIFHHLNTKLVGLKDPHCILVLARLKITLTATLKTLIGTGRHKLRTNILR